MNAGLYSAVSGGISALTRLDAITNNLANASTPGFKAERLVQRAEHVGTAPPSDTPIGCRPTNLRKWYHALGARACTGSPSSQRSMSARSASTEP